MPKGSIEPDDEVQLRMRAVSRLGGPTEFAAPACNVPAAYGVLYNLASSPSSAVDALALLHELQVHQVELELQAEEMRRSHAELEATLHRQRQLYESLPVGCFIIDIDTVILELNSAGAHMLGSTRDLLLGQPLQGLLLPESVHKLRTLMRRSSEGQPVETCSVQLIACEGRPRTVHATVNADPARNDFLVAFMDAAI